MFWITLTTWLLVKLLLRVMVTVPLPATIEPLTLVVLHPGPVQTEIGSAFALPWASAITPKTAKASNEFLRFENLGISVSLGVRQYVASSPQFWKQIKVVKAWDWVSNAGNARSNIPARKDLPVGARDKHTWHVPDT